MLPGKKVISQTAFFQHYLENRGVHNEPILVPARPPPVEQIVTGRELIVGNKLNTPLFQTWAKYRPGHWLASLLVQHASRMYARGPTKHKPTMASDVHLGLPAVI